jgi:hypothetical protein
MPTTTTTGAAADSNIRPTDWVWAQNLIAEMQADEHLRALAQKWQTAVTAISQAEAQSAEYDAERGAAIAKLIGFGHALQQLGQPVMTRHLELLWEHNYTPLPTDATTLGEITSLQARIFGSHAA